MTNPNAGRAVLADPVHGTQIAAVEPLTRMAQVVVVVRTQLGLWFATILAEEFGLMAVMLDKGN